MILIRNSFVAKAGQAGKLAQLFKDLVAALDLQGARVLTDVAGPFNTVVFEHQVQSLAEFESRLQEFGSNPVVREKMAGYTDLWETGRREMFKIW